MRTLSKYVGTALLACAVSIGANAAQTAPVYHQHGGLVSAADLVVARPLLLGATLVGSGLFVVSLPFTAIAGSVDSSAEALVRRPARSTFIRPLGAHRIR